MARVSVDEARGAKGLRAFEAFVDSDYTNKDADITNDSVSMLQSFGDDS
jgi:hypothetical protein